MELMSDAQWFTREEIGKLVGSPKGSTYTKEEISQLDRNASAQSHQKTSSEETANALAPSERKEGEGNTGGSGKGLTRVPPESAIAGQLIRLWSAGGLDLVSKL